MKLKKNSKLSLLCAACQTVQSSFLGVSSKQTRLRQKLVTVMILHNKVMIFLVLFDSLISGIKKCIACTVTIYIT